MRPELDAAPVASKRGKVWKAAALVLGFALTAALGSTAFVDWNFGDGPLVTPRFSASAFGEALVSHIGWLALFAVLSAAMLPLRAMQWQRTLEKRVPFSERWHFVNIGAAVHNLVPGNLGDVTRAFLLARTHKLPVVVALGSVAVCKLLELATLILLAGAVLLLPFWERLPQLVDALRVGAWICVGLVVVVVALARYARPIAERMHARRLLPRAQSFLLHVDRGLGTARSLRGLTVALIVSFPINLAASFAYGVGLEAIGVKHGLLAGTMVLALIALGKGTPGIPTGPGMYFLVASWAARALGASAQDAAAYALLTNVATGVSQWVPGLVSLAIRRVRWSELKLETSRAKDALRDVQARTGRASVAARNVPVEP